MSRCGRGDSKTLLRIALRINSGARACAGGGGGDGGHKFGYAPFVAFDGSIVIPRDALALSHARLIPRGGAV